jgi:hypothetical protein
MSYFGNAPDKIALKLTVDGIFIQQNLDKISPILAQASLDMLQVFEVSPSGYGIHWPLLDEDISIDGLLNRQHHPDVSRNTSDSFLLPSAAW